MLNQSNVRDLVIPTVARAKTRTSLGKVAFIAERNAWYRGTDADLTADDSNVIEARDVDTFWEAVTAAEQSLLPWKDGEDVITGDIRTAAGKTLVSLTDRTTSATLDDAELAFWGLASNETAEFSIAFGEGSLLPPKMPFGSDGKRDISLLPAHDPSGIYSKGNLVTNGTGALSANSDIDGSVTPVPLMVGAGAGRWSGIPAYSQTVNVTGALPLSNSLAVIHGLGFDFKLNGISVYDYIVPMGTGVYFEGFLEDGDVIKIDERSSAASTYNITVNTPNSAAKMGMLDTVDLLMGPDNMGNRYISVTNSVSFDADLSMVEPGNFWTVKNNTASPMTITSGTHTPLTGTGLNIPPYGAVTVIVSSVSGDDITFDVIGGMV